MGREYPGEWLPRSGTRFRQPPATGPAVRPSPYPAPVRTRPPGGSARVRTAHKRLSAAPGPDRARGQPRQARCGRLTNDRNGCRSWSRAPTDR
ncbi:hypothetical protein AN216_05670 [Streptomyces oceani]|uniref:Uncharacterized protein n=1 Tax=Streptomyces oceani TaxID=1075402 RepID=A0A1E7KLI8_9ACTN|nr:hypothetical protein AN216_05670 [Streptomyces oceani]